MDVLVKSKAKLIVTMLPKGHCSAAFSAMIDHIYIIGWQIGKTFLWSALSDMNANIALGVEWMRVKVEYTFTFQR